MRNIQFLAARARHGFFLYVRFSQFPSNYNFTNTFPFQRILREARSWVLASDGDNKDRRKIVPLLGIFTVPSDPTVFPALISEFREKNLKEHLKEKHDLAERLRLVRSLNIVVGNFTEVFHSTSHVRLQKPSNTVRTSPSNRCSSSFSNSAHQAIPNHSRRLETSTFHSPPALMEGALIQLRNEIG